MPLCHSTCNHIKNTYYVGWQTSAMRQHIIFNMQQCFQSLFNISYTLCSEKKPTYVFDYNTGTSWWIFILFIPMEYGMNTLQHIYLMAS